MASSISVASAIFFRERCDGLPSVETGRDYSSGDTCSAITGFPKPIMGLISMVLGSEARGSTTNGKTEQTFGISLHAFQVHA